MNLATDIDRMLVVDWVRCPVCDRTFRNRCALVTHLVLTKRHEDVVTYIRRLEFELAEMADNLKFWRDAHWNRHDGR